MSSRLVGWAARIGEFFRWIMQRESLEPMVEEPMPDVAEPSFLKRMVGGEELPADAPATPPTEPVRGWVRELLGRETLASDAPDDGAPAGRRSFLGMLAAREPLARDEPIEGAHSRRRSFLGMLAARESLGQDETTGEPPKRDVSSNS
jgi:hypothetical protein